MKKKYDNSLDNLMVRYGNRINNVNIIDKEDILAMFNNKETKNNEGKNNNKFRIFK